MAGMIDKIIGAAKVRIGKVFGIPGLEIKGKDELASGYAEAAVAEAQAGVRDYEARDLIHARQHEKACEKLTPQG
jgi:uncharacterized protein YjbJ (UPF0337 family)